MSTNLGTCRSCLAPVRWVMVAKSKRLMPVNPDPDASGNVVTLGSCTRDGIEEVRVMRKDESRAVAATLYRSHFASCPNVKTYRKART